MNHPRILTLTISLLATILSASSASASSINQPYAGQELRNIKSLDSTEVAGLLQGRGMGLAKPAELNHYPGPKHVLDLGDTLQLNDHQRRATQSLFDRMLREARPLGSQIVDREKQLDELFASGKATEEQLQSLLLEIGRLRSQLRFVHLRAHVAQRALLSAKQIEHYDAARGYHGGGHGQHSQHHEHH